MDESTKKRINVKIAGIDMSLVTDESDTYVRAVVQTVDKSMRALLQNIKRSQLDAALLCAIDFCGEMLNSEKKARNLEAQISLYDVNMKRLKDEISSLKRRLEEFEKDGKQLGIEDGEVELESDGSAASEEDAGEDAAGIARETADSTEEDSGDKLRMIEAMLKNKK